MLSKMRWPLTQHSSTPRGARSWLNLEVIRGTKVVLALPVEPGVVLYKIHIIPTFVLACFGEREDERELSAILERCGIVCGDGGCVELYGPKVVS